MDISALVRQISALLLLSAGLWLLHLYARVLPTGAVLGACVGLAFLIARGLFLRARLRRRVWLSAYLHSGSPLQLLLRGGLLMALMQGVLATGLAVAFLSTLIRSTDRFMFLLLSGAAVLMPLLNGLLQKLCRRHASALFLPELGWRLSSFVFGVVLIAILTWHGYQQLYPDFSDVTLEQAVWHMVGLQQARSDLLLMLLQMAAAGEGLRLWLAEQLLPTPGATLWQALGWIILLAQQALFVWSYLLLCRGMQRFHAVVSCTDQYEESD